ncbi:FAD-linked sulfhydryl oxidase ALR [Teleopsis dalmanni]|uniref:FAD-linked sulfhydryl oxidase ALR n=1 Tax=Teleopsis dalmanni TaxID=139649 RepID=UPI0018CD82AF|nr:FAD-linked sulfhydryl oxidase ALR [Teleopsis dalmanni]XP_037937228.1 FAD-linked sulfhydryl oxidase ALR [Teleopsis dalmanni]XP_037937229.1 FAD-linked sulfhydryl oxidase ALR [Teleopsis dalmanni]
MSKYDAYGTRTNPDPNCRTCTDFKSWSNQQRQVFHTKTGSDNTPAHGQESGHKRDDCPMDKSRLGHATWGLLHTFAAFYTEKPTEEQKADARNFFEALSKIYPCEYCANDFRKDLKQNPVNVESQSELSMWLCKFHNRVNAKLGKSLFDCSKVNERWRDGWLDGSCD